MSCRRPQVRRLDGMNASRQPPDRRQLPLQLCHHVAVQDMLDEIGRAVDVGGSEFGVADQELLPEAVIAREAYGFPLSRLRQPQALVAACDQTPGLKPEKDEAPPESRPGPHGPDAPKGNPVAGREAACLRGLIEAPQHVLAPD